MPRLNKKQLFAELLKNGKLTFNFPVASTNDIIKAKSKLIHQLYKLGFLEAGVTVYDKNLIYVIIAAHDIEMYTNISDTDTYRYNEPQYVHNSSFNSDLTKFFKNEKLRIII